MLLPWLLLLLLGSNSKASHFLGTVMTYYPKNTNANGSIKVVLRYKITFHLCTTSTWGCLSGNCGTGISFQDTVVDMESSGDWCQREGISTQLVPSNAPFLLLVDGAAWVTNNNNIMRWNAVTMVELRNRSDTSKANTSPQTTILPLVRVPSNCQRDFSLLVFDPDGDDVRCRYGQNTALSECNPCTPPSVLNLSSSCTLSFSPTSSTDEGPYAVQLVMEDFPKQTITLTQTNGAQTTLTTNSAISKIPMQFVLQVDPIVPSCTDGLYLPRFLPPTPDHRAQLYTAVNQTLEISIRAEANVTTISELLYSGPYNINLTTLVAGLYILSWTPSQNNDGESHSICFIVQAISSSAKYHSELRCVIVTVGDNQTTTTLMTPSTTTPIITTKSPTTTQTTTTTPIELTTTTQTTTTTPIELTTTTQTTSSTPSTTIHTTTSSATTQTTTPLTTTKSPTTTQTITTTPIVLTTTTQTTSSTPSTTIHTTTSSAITQTTTPLTTTKSPTTTTPIILTTTTQTTSSTPSTTIHMTTSSATTQTTTPLTTTKSPTTTQTTTTTPIVLTTTTQTTSSTPSTTIHMITSSATTQTTTPSRNSPLTTTTIATPTETPPTNISLTTSASTIISSTMPQTTTDTPNAANRTTSLTTSTSTSTSIKSTNTTPSTTTIYTTNTQNTATVPSVTLLTTTTTGKTPTLRPPPDTTAEDTTAYVTQGIKDSNQASVGLKAKISSLSPLSEEYITNTIIQQLKDELVRRGLPSNTTLQIKRVTVATTEAPGG